MRIQNKNLAQIRKDIKIGIFETVEAAQKADGPLYDLRTIHYGDRANISESQMPGLWVLPNAHVPNLLGGHTAQHDFNFSFVAMVYDYNAGEGAEQAEDLAARVYDVLIEDRTLGRRVHDVRPTSFNPAESSESSIFLCSFDMAFQIQRRE
jgi:hypothetical protein